MRETVRIEITLILLIASFFNLYLSDNALNIHFAEIMAGWVFKGHTGDASQGIAGSRGRR